ncbi:hypothetical protein MRS44_012218 [Fusarium solani]|uniref:uncharacterized protein n=1 Tax=Fusarium solani TaxID=169388 RepID=UPI0032C471E2|nr:hypothetical protein MRS44_012218 [Fusarium solani]
MRPMQQKQPPDFTARPSAHPSPGQSRSHLPLQLSSAFPPSFPPQSTWHWQSTTYLPLSAGAQQRRRRQVSNPATTTTRLDSAAAASIDHAASLFSLPPLPLHLTTFNPILFFFLLGLLETDSSTAPISISSSSKQQREQLEAPRFRPPAQVPAPQRQRPGACTAAQRPDIHRSPSRPNNNNKTLSPGWFSAYPVLLPLPAWEETSQFISSCRLVELAAFSAWFLRLEPRLPALSPTRTRTGGIRHVPRPAPEGTTLLSGWPLLPPSP